MLSRRTLLLGGVLGLAGCLFEQCDRKSPTVPDLPGEGGVPPDPGPGPTPPPGRRRAPSPIGYSNVASLDAAEAQAVFAAGLLLVQAEALPFGRGWDSFDLNRLKAIAQVARSAGGTFLITLVNANGRVQLRLHERHPEADAFFRDRVRQIAQEVGPGNVWFEGVSEPWVEGQGLARERTLRWQRIALDEWPGTDVVNGDDFRGDIQDVHHCAYDRLLAGLRSRPNQLNSTDCTPILASSLREARVREATRVAVERNARFICYDTSNVPRGNDQVIRWMSEELPAA